MTFWFPQWRSRFRPIKQSLKTPKKVPGKNLVNTVLLKKTPNRWCGKVGERHDTWNQPILVVPVFYQTVLDLQCCCLFWGDGEKRLSIYITYKRLSHVRRSGIKFGHVLNHLVVDGSCWRFTICGWSPNEIKPFTGHRKKSKKSQQETMP